MPSSIVYGKMSHEFQPKAHRRQPSRQEPGFYEYYGIGSRTPKAQRVSETRANKSSRKKLPPTLSFDFQVCGQPVKAYYYKRKGFERLSLGEKTLLAIGQSSSFSQTPQTQTEFIQALTSKADTDEGAPFEDRFKDALDQEIEAGRVIIGDEGHLQLTEESLDVLMGAIQRTQSTWRPGQ